MANEPFEHNWQILIWRLRRGYYSTDVANLAINSQICQIAKLKLPPNFPRYTVNLLFIGTIEYNYEFYIGTYLKSNPGVRGDDIIKHLNFLHSERRRPI